MDEGCEIPAMFLDLSVKAGEWTNHHSRRRCVSSFGLEESSDKVGRRLIYAVVSLTDTLRVA